MTQRERTMATVVGGLGLFGMGFFGVVLFYNAYSSSLKTIELLDKNIEEAKSKKMAVLKDAPLLNRFRKLSLGADLAQDKIEYRDYLKEKLRQHGMTNSLEFTGEPQDTKSSIVHPTKAGKQPVYIGINYVVRLRATMANLVSFIQDFQKTPKLQRIKGLVIERPDDKKEGQLLTVQMTFEALAVLDAEAQLKKQSSQIPVPVAKWDAIAFMLKGPTGLATLGWSVGPNSPRVTPLNPPQTATRDYSDIAKRNVFLSWAPPKPPQKEVGTSISPKGGAPLDDVINGMRFMRLVSLTEGLGVVEGGLWDMSVKSTSEYEKVKADGGFNKWTLVRTDKNVAILQGHVLKVQDHDIVFRVMLRSVMPKKVKWHRYPDGKFFYTLHSQDFADLLKKGTVGEGDRANLYLVHQKYWESLLGKTNKGKIVLNKDKKSFVLAGDGSTGSIVFGDNNVVIIRLNEGWPPSSAAPKAPSIAADQMYPDDPLQFIFNIQTDHFNDLLADNNKKLQLQNPLKASNIERVYVMHAKYWDYLTSLKILRQAKGGTEFTFGCMSNTQMVCGEIVSTDHNLVVFRVWEQYCHCSGDPGDKEKGVAPIEERWHEGICTLRIGDMVQDALWQPVPQSKVKDWLKIEAGH